MCGSGGERSIQKEREIKEGQRERERLAGRERERQREYSTREAENPNSKLHSHEFESEQALPVRAFLFFSPISVPVASGSCRIGGGCHVSCAVNGCQVQPCRHHQASLSSFLSLAFSLF